MPALCTEHSLGVVLPGSRVRPHFPDQTTEAQRGGHLPWTTQPGLRRGNGTAMHGWGPHAGTETMSP